ncbi:response regulator [Piscinibacter sp.]|uniref:response regulator n=1 Tax=Piscinibacter sp. TaxID=1903157 RepID=UPI0039E4A9A8
MNNKLLSDCIKVLLLDDHAVVRHGYRRWIDGEDDMCVVAEAATSAQACECLRQAEIDIAVIDLSLKNDSGLEAMRRLRERQPRLKMLAFTMHDHAGFALQALRLGAMGYVTKDSEPQQLLDALRQVAEGRRVFSGEVAQFCLAQAQAGESAFDPFAQLTPREFEVLRLTTSGQDAAVIAQALHVSQKTVLNTMSQVRQKLDVRNDFRLMRLAEQHGLAGLGAAASALPC